MKLSPADVSRLYGKRLFIITDSPATPPEISVHEDQKHIEEATQPGPKLGSEEPVVDSSPPSIDKQPLAQPEKLSPPSPEQEEHRLVDHGAAVQWKMKPQARIALVMHEAEYKNRALTVALRDCVVRAGIDTQFIGFGVMPEGAPPADFSTQPTPFSIAFDPQLNQEKAHVLSEEREIWGQPQVAKVILDLTQQEQLVQLLQKLAKRL